MHFAQCRSIYLLAFSTSFTELGSIISRLQIQSQNFDVCLANTAEMLRKSAWTSGETQTFLNSIQDLDKEALQELAGKLQATIQQTKSDILSLVEELRSINSSIDGVTAEVSQLVTSVAERQRSNAEEQIAVDTQRSQAQRKAISAHNTRGNALAGCGVGTICMAIIFPPLIPVVWCISATAACMADNASDNAAAEVIRLQERHANLANLYSQLQDSLSKATILQQALPILLERFQAIYEFWNGMDTAVKAIRVQGESKLMYKRYALAWGALQQELGRNAEQLLTL